MEALKHSYKILSYNPETPLTNTIPPFNVYGTMNKLLRDMPLIKEMVGRTTVDYDSYGSIKYIYNVKSKNYTPTVYEFIDVGSSDKEYAIENKINFTITGAFQVEMDLLIHEFTRYLSTLYPNHKNYIDLYTDEELNDSFDETAHFLGYELNSAKHDLLVQNIFGGTDEYEAFYRKYRNFLAISLIQNSIGQDSSYRQSMALLGFDAQVYTAGRIRGNSDKSRVDTVELASLTPFRTYASNLQSEVFSSRISKTSTTVENNSLASISQEITDTDISGNVKNYFVYNGEYSSSEPLFSNSIGALTIDTAHSLIVTDIDKAATHSISSFKVTNKSTVGNSYTYDYLFNKTLSTDPTEDLTHIKTYDNIYKSYIYANYSSIVGTKDDVINLTGKDDGTSPSQIKAGEELGGLLKVFNELYHKVLNKVSQESMSVDLTSITLANALALNDNLLSKVPAEYSSYLTDDLAHEIVQEYYNVILGEKNGKYTDEDKFVFIASPKDTNKYFVINAADTSKAYVPSNELFLTRQSFQNKIDDDVYTDTANKSPDFIGFSNRAPSSDFVSLMEYLPKLVGSSAIASQLSEALLSISSKNIAIKDTFKEAFYWKTFLSRDFVYSAKNETITGDFGSFLVNTGNIAIIYRVKNSDGQALFSGISGYETLYNIGTSYSIADSSLFDSLYSKSSKGLFNDSSKGLYKVGDKFSLDVEVVNIAMLLNALYFKAIKEGNTSLISALDFKLKSKITLSKVSETVTPQSVLEDMYSLDLSMFNTTDILGYVHDMIADMLSEVATSSSDYKKLTRKYKTLETEMPYIDMISPNANSLGIGIVKNLYNGLLSTTLDSGTVIGPTYISNVSFYTNINFVESVYSLSYFNLTSYINAFLSSLDAVYSQEDGNWKKRLQNTINIETFKYDAATNEKTSIDSYNATFTDYFGNVEFMNKVISAFVAANDNTSITKPNSTIVSSYSTLFKLCNISSLQTVLESQANTVTADFSTVSLRVSDGQLITDSAEDASKFETGDLIRISNNGVEIATLSFNNLEMITNNDLSSYYVVHFFGETSGIYSTVLANDKVYGLQTLYHQRPLSSKTLYKNQSIKNNESNVRGFSVKKDLDNAEYVKRVNDSSGNFKYVISVVGNMISPDYYTSNIFYPANVETLADEKYVDNSDPKEYADIGFEEYLSSSDSETNEAVNATYNTVVSDPTLLLVDITLNRVLHCNGNEVLMCEDIAERLDTDIDQVNTILANAQLVFGISVALPVTSNGSSISYSADSKTLTYICNVDSVTSFGPSYLMPNTLYAFGGSTIEDYMLSNSVFETIVDISNSIDDDCEDGDLEGYDFKINDIYNLSRMMWGAQIWDASDTAASITSESSVKSEDFRSFRAIWSSITVQLQLIANFDDIVTSDIVSNFVQNNYNLLQGNLSKYNYQASSSRSDESFYDLNAMIQNKGYYEYKSSNKVAATSYLASRDNIQISKDHFGTNMFADASAGTLTFSMDAFSNANLDRFFVSLRSKTLDALVTNEKNQQEFDTALSTTDTDIAAGVIKQMLGILLNNAKSFSINTYVTADSAVSEIKNDDLSYSAVFDQIVSYYGIALFSSQAIDTYNKAITKKTGGAIGNYNKISGAAFKKASVLHNVSNDLSSKGAFVESLSNNPFLNAITSSFQIASSKSSKSKVDNAITLNGKDVDFVKDVPLSDIAGTEFTIAYMLDIAFKAVYEMLYEKISDEISMNTLSKSTTSLQQLVLSKDLVDKNGYTMTLDGIVNLEDENAQNSRDKFFEKMKSIVSGENGKVKEKPAVLIYSGICDRLEDLGDAIGTKIDLSLDDPSTTEDKPLYNLRKLVNEGHANRQMFMAILNGNPADIIDNIKRGQTITATWTILPITGSPSYLSNVTNNLAYSSTYMNANAINMFYNDNDSAKQAYYANFANYIDQFYIKSSDLANLKQMSLSYDGALANSSSDLSKGLKLNTELTQNSSMSYDQQLIYTNANSEDTNIKYVNSDNGTSVLTPALRYKYFKMFDSQIIDLYITYETNDKGELTKYYNTKFSKALDDDAKYAVIANMSKTAKRYPYAAANEMQIVSNKASLGDLFPIAVSSDGSNHVRLLMTSNPYNLSSNMQEVKSKISASDGNVLPASSLSNFLSFTDKIVDATTNTTTYDLSSFHSFTVTNANAFKSPVGDNDNYSTSSMFTTGMRFFKNYFISSGTIDNDSRSIVSLDASFVDGEDLETYITAGDKVYIAYIDEFEGDVSSLNLQTTSPIINQLLGDIDTVSEDKATPSNSKTLTDPNAANNPEYNTDYVIEAAAQGDTDKFVSALAVPIQGGIGSLTIVNGYDGNDVASNDKLMVSAIYTDGSTVKTVKYTVSASEILNAFTINEKCYGLKIERPYQEHEDATDTEVMKFRITANISDIVDESSGTERHIYDNVPKLYEWLLQAKNNNASLSIPEFIEGIIAKSSKSEAINFIKTNCGCSAIKYATEWSVVESDDTDEKATFLEESTNAQAIYYDAKGIVSTENTAGYDNNYLSAYLPYTEAPAQALLQYYKYIDDNYDKDSAALKARETLIAQAGSTDEAFAQSHINDVMTRNGALRVVDGDVYIKTRLYEVAASVSDSVLNALDNITDAQEAEIKSKLDDIDSLNAYLTANKITIPSNVKDMSTFDVTSSGSHWTTGMYWKRLTDDDSMISTTFYENDDDDINGLSVEDMVIQLSQDSYNISSVISAYQSVNIEDQYNLAYTQIKQGITSPITSTYVLDHIDDNSMMSTASFFYKTLKYFNETLLNKNGDNAFTEEDGELKAKSTSDLSSLKFNFKVADYTMPVYKAIDMEDAEEGKLKAKTIKKSIPVYSYDSNGYSMSNLTKEVMKPLTPFIEYVFGNDYYNITPLTYIDQAEDESRNGNLSLTDLYALTEDKYIVNARVDSRAAAISVDDDPISFGRFLPSFQFACSENGVNKKIAAEQRVYIKVPDNVLFEGSIPYDHTSNVYKIFAKMALEGNLDNFALRYRGTAKVAGYSVVLAKIANSLGIHFDEADGYMDLVQKNADGTTVTKNVNGETVPVALAEAIQNTIDNNESEIASWTMPTASGLQKIEKDYIASHDISSPENERYNEVKKMIEALNSGKDTTRYHMWSIGTYNLIKCVIKPASGEKVVSPTDKNADNIGYDEGALTSHSSATYDYDTASGMKTGYYSKEWTDDSSSTLTDTYINTKANNFDLMIKVVGGVHDGTVAHGGSVTAYAKGKQVNGGTGAAGNRGLTLFEISNKGIVTKIGSQSGYDTYSDSYEVVVSSTTNADGSVTEVKETRSHATDLANFIKSNCTSTSSMYALVSCDAISINVDLKNELANHNVTVNTIAAARAPLAIIFTAKDRTSNVNRAQKFNVAASSKSTTSYFVLQDSKGYYSTLDTFCSQVATYVGKPVDTNKDNTNGKSSINSIVTALTKLQKLYELWDELHNANTSLTPNIKSLLDKAQDISDGKIQFASSVEDLYAQLLKEIKSQQGLTANTFGTVSGKLGTSVSTIDSMILSKKLGETYVTGDEAAAMNDSDSTIVAITVPFVNGSRYMRSLIKDLKFKTKVTSSGTIIFAYGYAELPGWEEIPGETVVSKNQHAMAICKQAYELVKTHGDCANLQAALLSVVGAASNTTSAETDYTMYAAHRRFGVIAYSTDYGYSYTSMSVPTGISGFGDAVMTCNVSDGSNSTLSLEGWLEQREWGSTYAATVNKAKFTPYTISLSIGVDSTENEMNFAYVSIASSATEDFYEGGFTCSYNATPEEILSSAASTSSTSDIGSSAANQSAMRGIANAIGIDKLYVNAYDPTAIGLNPTSTSSIDISTSGDIYINNDLTADEVTENYKNATVTSTNTSVTGRVLTISSIDTASNTITLDGEVGVNPERSGSTQVMVSVYDDTKDTPNQSEFIDQDILNAWLQTASKTYENLSPVKFVEEVGSYTIADRVLQPKYDLGNGTTVEQLASVDGYPTVYEDSSQIYYQYDSSDNPIKLYNMFGNTVKINDSSFNYLYIKQVDSQYKDGLVIGTTGFMNIDDLSTADELDELATAMGSTATLGPMSFDDMACMSQPVTDVSPESLSSIKLSNNDSVTALDNALAASTVKGYYVENGALAIDISSSNNEASTIASNLKYSSDKSSEYGLDYEVSAENAVGMAYYDTTDNGVTTSTPMFYNDGTAISVSYNASPYAPTGTTSYLSSVKTLLDRVVVGSKLIAVSSVTNTLGGTEQNVTTSDGSTVKAHSEVTTDESSNVMLAISNDPLSSIISESADGEYAEISQSTFDTVQKSIGSTYVTAPGYGITLDVKADYKTSYLPRLEPVGSLIDVSTGRIDTDSDRIVLPLNGYGFSQPSATDSLDEYKDNNGYYVPYAARNNWTNYNATVYNADTGKDENRVCHYDAFDGLLFSSAKLTNANGKDVYIVSPFDILGKKLAYMPVPTYSSFKEFCAACGSTVYLPLGSVFDVNGEWTENEGQYSNIYKMSSSYDNVDKYAYSIVNLMLSAKKSQSLIKDTVPLFGSTDNTVVEKLYDDGVSVLCDVSANTTEDDLKNSNITLSHKPIEVDSTEMSYIGATRKAVSLINLNGSYTPVILPNSKSLNYNGKLSDVPANWSEFIVNKQETDRYGNGIYLANTDGKLIRLRQASQGGSWSVVEYNDVAQSSKLLQKSLKMLYTSICSYYKSLAKHYITNNVMFCTLSNQADTKYSSLTTFSIGSSDNIASIAIANASGLVSQKTLATATVSGNYILFKQGEATTSFLQLSATKQESSFGISDAIDLSNDKSTLQTADMFEIDCAYKIGDIAIPYFNYDGVSFNDNELTLDPEYVMRSFNVSFEIYKQNAVKNSLFIKDSKFDACKGDDVRLLVLTDYKGNVCGWTWLKKPLLIDIDKHMLAYKIHFYK